MPASLPTAQTSAISAHLQLNRIERSWRWAKQNISGFGIERTIVAGTLETLMRAFEVDRTSEVGAFLTEGMKLTIERADEDRRVIG